MFQKDKLLRTFSQPEDKLFVTKVLDQATLCYKNHTKTFTDFMDMTKYGKILKILPELTEISYESYGGYQDAERKMIGFYQDYDYLGFEDFPLTVLKIVNTSSIGREITHRDYLGAILHTGIDRGKVGDIIVTQDSALIFVHTNISEFIRLHLDKVGNKPVSIEEIDQQSIILPEPKIKEIRSTVSSLRIDSIISTGFSTSRGKSVQYIKAQKAFVNWVPVHSPSDQVKEGDIVTLRGAGRIKLASVGGKTKKDRISIIIHRYV